MLLTFGEVAISKSDAALEVQFAAALPKLSIAAKAVNDMTLLLVNLLQQLGALCSEQTRKSTVISGDREICAGQLTMLTASASLSYQCTHCNDSYARADCLAKLMLPLMLLFTPAVC